MTKIMEHCSLKFLFVDRLFLFWGFPYVVLKFFVLLGMHRGLGVSVSAKQHTFSYTEPFSLTLVLLLKLQTVRHKKNYLDMQVDAYI